MFYSNKPKVVFVAIPKTGTRTIYDVLTNHFGGQLYREHHQTIPAEMKNHFSFTTIRNPYDRVSSMWWSTSKRGLDKRGFVQEAKKRGWENTLNSFVKIIQARGVEYDRISRTMASFIDGNKIDAKLRFDHLEEDFNKLPFVTKKIELPLLNMTKEVTGPNPHARPPWQTLVNEETISIINKVYVKDFAATGYDMITDYETWKKEQDDE